MEPILFTFVEGLLLRRSSWYTGQATGMIEQRFRYETARAGVQGQKREEILYGKSTT
jgi:hypothetical protein